MRDLEREWHRLNEYGVSGCRGSLMLRLSKMDAIAVKIGYPLSKPVYLEDEARLDAARAEQEKE